MRPDAWLTRAARAHPDRLAVGDLTYTELDDRAGRAASALGGNRPGERVGLALSPGEDFAVALHAVWRAGAIAVPHDGRLTPAERPAADLVLEGVDLAARPAAPRPLDLGATAVVLQTSGTTGGPREVHLSFANLQWSALGSGVALGVRPDDRWLCVLPLSHVGGLSIVVRSAIYATHAVLHERFEADRVVHALRHDGVTLVSLVPTTLARLLDAGLRDVPALRCALIGGAPVAPDLMARAREAGVPVAQTYGLTEACSQVTTARPGDEGPDAGPPLFCTRVRTDDAGEIHVSGPTIAGGGELATGDLGRLDEHGRLTVTGRKADTIVSGGENVAPAEVEAALEAHPAVAEAAVHGRPDPEWGEAVVAVVVLRPGHEVSEAELRAHVGGRLARFKVPKAVVVREAALPRTRSGKLQRWAL